MLVGYDLRRDWAHTLGGGATWAPTDAGNPAYLDDMAPAEAAMLTWPSGAQTTSTAITESATTVRQFVPRVGAMLGVSVQPGLRVEIRGRRAADDGYTYNLGGNSLTQRLVRMPDGSSGCIWIFDAGLDPIIGRQVTIYNDAGGVAVITAEQDVSIGEIVIAPALQICQSLGQQEAWTDPSIMRRSMASQVSRVRRSAYRTLRIQGAPMLGSAWVDGGWQDIQASLSASPYTLLVSHESDYEMAQRTSMFGVASGLGIGLITRAYQRPDEMTVAEIPAR